MSKAVNRAIYRFHCRMRELQPEPMPTAEKQWLARAVREDSGTELTPDQAEALLKRAYERIREAMVEKGYVEFAAMRHDELRRWVHESLAE